MFRHQTSIDQRINRVIVGNNSTVSVGIQDSSRGPEQQNAQQALSFPEMYNRFHEISDATAGTCQWILENHTLREWQNAQRGLLWIKGKPGVGKSTIMKYTWDHFTSESGSKTQNTASFFCHGRGVDLQKSSTGVFRALLHQIVEKVPQLNEDLENKFRARCKTQGKHGSDWNWTESELRNLTQDYLLRACRDSSLLVFVDALDECGEDSARELLDFFQSVVTASEIYSDSTFKICVSSRQYPLVRLDVLYEIIVDSENLADIRTYVDQKLHRFRNRTREYDGLSSFIVSRAGEIFQWCVLVVARVTRSLESKKPVELILQEIQETPQELFELYRQIIRSYMNNTDISPRDKKQFSDLFQWVALAKRPCSVSTLRSAIWIDHPDSCYWRSLLARDDAREEDHLGADIEYLSCGLVKVEVFDVEFIHQSVQDYFVSGGGIRDLRDSGSETTAIRMAELDIVRICYKSILLSQPQVDTHPQHLLLEYAQEHIFDHARSAERGQPVQNDLAEILNFPEDDCASKILSNLIDDRAEDDRSSESLSYLDDDYLPRLAKLKLRWRSKLHKRSNNLLHTAAMEDIPNLISSVLNLAPGMSINIRDSQNETALQIAARLGNFDSMNRLLDISQTFASKPILHWQRRGSRVLDLNVHDYSGLTPLMHAASYGCNSIVERLA